MDDWLDNLELDDLTIEQVRSTKLAKRTAKRLAGEKHTFVERKPLLAPPLREPRRVGPDQLVTSLGKYTDHLGQKARTRFAPSRLAKASYTPAHMLGISPVWPCHYRINL